MCVQCLSWFKSIHRFMAISRFVKIDEFQDRWAGISHSGQDVNHLYLKYADVHPAASQTSTLETATLQPIYFLVVSWNEAGFTSPPYSTQPQGFSIDRGNFIFFLWFCILHVTFFFFYKRGHEAPRDGLRRSETVSDGLRRSPAPVKWPVKP